MPIEPISESENQALDDDLARFADQLLSGTEHEKVEMIDTKAADLQKTVQRLHSAVESEQPDAAMVARIKARLRKEWADKPRERKPVWGWSKLVFAGAAIVFVLAALIFLGNPGEGQLTGSADGIAAWTPLFVFLGVIFIVIYLWIDRRR